MKIFFLIITCLISVFLNAQNEGINLSKYWNYRYSLNGDAIDPSFGRWEPGFVEVGSGPGYSLPMRGRRRFHASDDIGVNKWWKIGDPITQWSFDNVPPCRFTDNGKNWTNNPTLPHCPPGAGDRYGGLKWGDCPTDQGKYLMVLATELELLILDANRYNTVNLTNMSIYNPALVAQMMKTYFEIDKALDAFNRLDYIAEGQYGKTASSNGFFVRDDVPSNFNDDCKFGCAQNNLGFNLFNPNFSTNTYYRGNSFYLSMSDHVSAREINTYAGCIGADPLYCATSQDQMYKVLIGIIYAKRVCNMLESKYFMYNNNQTNFIYTNSTGKAHDIIDRTLWNLFPWYILDDPNGNQVCGGNFNAYSGPIYNIYQKYGDGGLPIPFINNNLYLAWLNSSTVGESIWLGQKIILTPSIASSRKLFGSRGTVIPLVGAYHSWEMYAYLCAMDNRDAAFFPNSLYLMGDELDFRGGDESYWVNYYMEGIKNQLHGGGFSINIGTGGFSLGIPNWYPVAEYDIFMNRSNFENCEHDTRNIVKGSSPNYIFEENNGLDYMLAANLYLLQKDREDRIDVTNNQLATFVPMYDREIDLIYPATRSYNCKLLSPPNTWPPITNVHSTFITYGSKTNPLIIEAANSITARKAVFNSDAKVDIIAPHTDLLPGFHAVYGSVCTVYNERLKCTSYITNNSCGIGLKSAVISDDIKQEKPTSISLYPNPTSENTSIKLSNYNNLTVKIGIYDMIGKLKSREYIAEVANNEDEKDINLDTESLPVGIYIVKVSHGDTYTSVKLEKR